MALAPFITAEERTQLETHSEIQAQPAFPNVTEAQTQTSQVSQNNWVPAIPSGGSRLPLSSRPYADTLSVMMLTGGVGQLSGHLFQPLTLALGRGSAPMSQHLLTLGPFRCMTASQSLPFQPQPSAAYGKRPSCIAHSEQMGSACFCSARRSCGKPTVYDIRIASTEQAAVITTGHSDGYNH